MMRALKACATGLMALGLCASGGAAHAAAVLETVTGTIMGTNLYFQNLPAGNILVQFTAPGLIDGYLEQTFDYRLDAYQVVDGMLVGNEAVAEVFDNDGENVGAATSTPTQGSHYFNQSSYFTPQDTFSSPFSTDIFGTPIAVETEYRTMQQNTTFSADVLASSVGQQYTLTVSAVPEPSTWLLMFAGIGGIGLMLRRARRTMRFRFEDAFVA